MRIAARAVEGRLNADLSDYKGTFLPCRCGSRMRYVGRRERTFTTVLGGMTLMRAYYHCTSCGVGSVPRDQALLMEHSLSPGVTRMTGLAAAMVSFEEVSSLLSELAGVTVNAKQAERTAEVLGKRIAEDERTHSEPEERTTPTLYLGIDGTGIPIRPSEPRANNPTAHQRHGR
jgi:hypothetical protein